MSVILLNAALTGLPTCDENCRLDYLGCGRSECESGKQCSGDILQFCSDHEWVDVMDCGKLGLTCDVDSLECVEGHKDE